MRGGNLGLSVAVAATFGCTTLQIDYQRLPAPEVLASVQEGVTTRREVLERLGPPEEFRQPSPFDRARSTSPQRRRILEGGEVFIRDFFTYASERYTTRTFGLLPVGPSLFRVTWRKSREDRWRLEFDENDVVRTVSHVDESADARR
jgi:hypothetical protein